MPIQVWILALAAIAGIIGLAVLVLRRSGAAASGNAELPTEWPLTQRPIFSPEERAEAAEDMLADVLESAA